jgi:hypothetical protein
MKYQQLNHPNCGSWANAAMLIFTVTSQLRKTAGRRFCSRTMGISAAQVAISSTGYQSSPGSAGLAALSHKGPGRFVQPLR